jgi:hypothetical protein
MLSKVAKWGLLFQFIILVNVKTWFCGENKNQSNHLFKENSWNFDVHVKCILIYYISQSTKFFLICVQFAHGGWDSNDSTYKWLGALLSFYFEFKMSKGWKVWNKL